MIDLNKTLISFLVIGLVALILIIDIRIITNAMILAIVFGCIYLAIDTRNNN